MRTLCDDTLMASAVATRQQVRARLAALVLRAPRRARESRQAQSGLLTAGLCSDMK